LYVPPYKRESSSRRAAAVQLGVAPDAARFVVRRFCACRDLAGIALIVGSRAAARLTDPINERLTGRVHRGRRGYILVGQLAHAEHVAPLRCCVAIALPFRVADDAAEAQFR